MNYATSATTRTRQALPHTSINICIMYMLQCFITSNHARKRTRSNAVQNSPSHHKQQCSKETAISRCEAGQQEILL